jgi:hypothetical protein
MVVLLQKSKSFFISLLLGDQVSIFKNHVNDSQKNRKVLINSALYKQAAEQSCCNNINIDKFACTSQNYEFSLYSETHLDDSVKMTVDWWP